MHPIQWRYNAEELVRLRRAGEQRRYAAPQRAGKVDANPHQIEAVIFALSRLREGGCILADEVGLGKTIEAGLVIAQLRAEGAQRVLLVTPKSLIGQWRQELYDLFRIELQDGVLDEGVLDAPGVLIIGRELAGSERGQAALLASPAFDLIVIDEAHEIFSGLHKRVDASGALRDSANAARMAGRVFDFLRASGAPVLLLTATPIQNSLAELWALVQYVDHSGTLLGNLSTFRQMFCDEDDRALVEGQEQELRRRINVVLRRTLRRQAQEFLAKPFVGRVTRLFEYRMSPDEASLYDDVTRYLLEPNLAAFRGNQRRLLLIAFQRRMASSSRALADSLEKVRLRLRGILERAGEPPSRDPDGAALVSDFDGEDLEELAPDEADSPSSRALESLSPDKVRSELARVEDFIGRARALGADSKAHALIEAIRLVRARRVEGKGSGKIVLFTESLATQDYIRELLMQSRVVTDEDITIFRGTNDSARAKQALERWWAEVGEKLPSHSRPSPEIAMRLALVHEFRERSSIFISTEAGAKGLNLQFSETVVNYDLPWNPQRIEQRIGRCHRYGQTRDVTVINFIAKDNETDRLLFEILAKKLDLFGTVLDASDNVIHEPGTQQAEVLASTVGAEVEASLRRIWERARTIEERTEELRQLRERMTEERRRFEDAHARTAGLIETCFDEEVRNVFLRRREELPRVLAELDTDIEKVVTAYLEHIGAPHARSSGALGGVLTIEPCERLPEPLRRGLKVAVGMVPGVESLHLGHPLVLAAVDKAREATSTIRGLAFEIDAGAPADLAAHRGSRGRFVLLRVRYEGLEPFDAIWPIAVLEGDEPLPAAASVALLSAQISDLSEGAADEPAVSDEAVLDVIDEALFREQADASTAELDRFERSVEQLERYVEDRILLRKRDKASAEASLEAARERRDQALSVDRREEAERAVLRVAAETEALDAEIARLERREDEVYQRCRERLYARRFAPPKIERLADLEIELR